MSFHIAVQVTFPSEWEGGEEKKFKLKNYEELKRAVSEA
jgi:hypothetical protein